MPLCCSSWAEGACSERRSAASFAAALPKEARPSAGSWRSASITEDSEALTGTARSSDEARVASVTTSSGFSEMVWARDECTAKAAVAASIVIAAAICAPAAVAACSLANDLLEDEINAVAACIRAEELGGGLEPSDEHAQRDELAECRGSGEERAQRREQLAELLRREPVELLSARSLDHVAEDHEDALVQLGRLGARERAEQRRQQAREALGRCLLLLLLAQQSL